VRPHDQLRHVDPPARRARHRRRLGAVLFVVGALTVAACGGGTPHEFSGSVRQPFPSVDVVALPDASADDAPFDLRAPDGGLLLVYFGYTFCPDMCPTTLSDVKTALGELGEDADLVEVAFVTVDPDRDTGEQLTGYIDFFAEGRGHALRTTDPDTLRSAADAFGVRYEVTTNDEGEVEVGHTGNLYAVDDQGRLLVTWPFGVSVEALTADLRYLLDAEPGSDLGARIRT
jgi:protein SCO1